MLSDLASVRTFLRIPQSDTSSNPLLNILLPMADRAVKSWCKQHLETRINTEYRDGSNAVDLALYQKYVHASSTTGNLAASSAVVTGIPDTSKMLVGMPVTSQATANPTSLIPNNTTISSIDSATQITLSQACGGAATASPFAYGIAVWYDPLGYGGNGPGIAAGGPFAANTLLVLGRGFDLTCDLNDGFTSKSGVIRRIGYGWAPYFGWGAGCNYGATGYGKRGGLSARLPPTWGNTYRGLKIVYASGVAAPGEYGTPPELTFCVNAIVGWMRAITPAGVPIDAGAITAQVSAQLSHQTAGENPEVGTVRAILRRFREVSI